MHQSPQTHVHTSLYPDTCPELHGHAHEESRPITRLHFMKVVPTTTSDLYTIVVRARLNLGLVELTLTIIWSPVGLTSSSIVFLLTCFLFVTLDIAILSRQGYLLCAFHMFMHLVRVVNCRPRPRPHSTWMVLIRAHPIKDNLCASMLIASSIILCVVT